jgi:hypothetical protein
MAEPALPNLVIIGAAKAATTSLHYYLSLHPQVCMSEPKKTQFFVEPGNWQRGVQWYKSHFDAAAPVRGEASPPYTAHPFHPGVAERMASIIPDARLIYLVRDPVDRLVAGYIHAVSDGREDRSLGAALADFDKSILFQTSRYHFQIKQYLPYYPLERILIVEQEFLRRERRATLRQIFNFLEIDPNFEHPGFFKEKNISSSKRRKNSLGLAIQNSLVGRVVKRFPREWRSQIHATLYKPFSTPIPRPVVDPELRQRLADTLGPDVQSFRKLTGQSFAHWSL